jgi:hypothetical protein
VSTGQSWQPGSSDYLYPATQKSHDAFQYGAYGSLREAKEKNRWDPRGRVFQKERSLILTDLGRGCLDDNSVFNLVYLWTQLLAGQM